MLELIDKVDSQFFNILMDVINEMAEAANPDKGDKFESGTY